MMLEKITNNITSEKIDFSSDEFERIAFLYKSAMMDIELKIKRLKEEYEMLGSKVSIEGVQTRIKKNKSIIRKMERKNCEQTYLNMVENLDDIAGIRVISNFKDGIYKIVHDVEKMPGIKVVKSKDYVENPKESGYMSYHMIIEVPVTFVGKLIYVKVEMQIRTLAMEFWSSIEHKAKYKNEADLDMKISKKFVKYARYIERIENSMKKIIINTQIPLKS